MFGLRKKLELIVLSFAVLVPVLAVSPAGAQDFKKNLCGGANLSLSDSGGTCTEGGPQNSLDRTIRNIINILTVIVGIVAVIMIIIGGFKYITSGGDSGNITSARNTVLYAIVGLVIVALAQIIVRFVLNSTT